MGRTSENALAATAGFIRIFAAIAFIAIGISMLPGQVRSQTTGCSKLIADMAAQHKMIGIFRSLDYQIREHFLIEANAILSTYGGWNSIDRGNDATNASKLRDNKIEFQTQAAVIKRDIGRSGAISEEESQRFNKSIDGFLKLIETGDQIAKAIEDGKVDEANRIYYETARPAYLQVHGDLYTLILMAERRVASMARTPCG